MSFKGITEKEVLDTEILNLKEEIIMWKDRLDKAKRSTLFVMRNTNCKFSYCACGQVKFYGEGCPDCGRLA